MPDDTSVMTFGRKWFPYVRTKPTAYRRLFCFSHAGGTAGAYAEWTNCVDDDTELWAVQLPGREGRLSEPLFHSLEPLAKAVTEAIIPLLDKSFAFFGHSMGALLAYETALRLRQENRQGPEHLFLSAHRAAHLPLQRSPLYHLPERELIDQLRLFGGTEEELFADQQIMELYMPIIRADLSVCDTYVHHPESPLSVPITVFGGTDDPDVSPRELAEWRDHTSDVFTLRMFQGGHFYLYDYQEEILSLVQNLWDQQDEFEYYDDCNRSAKRSADDGFADAQIACDLSKREDQRCPDKGAVSG